jgi:peptidoglycan hydrolase CwlO-like protein
MARLISLGCGLTLAVLVMAPVRADTRSQLKSAEAKVRALIGRIAQETKTVQTLEAQANVIAQQVDRIQSQLSLTQGRIVDLEQGMRLASDQLAATQGQLDQRAWLAYEEGPGSSLDFLLGSTSLADLTDRLEIMNHVAQTDVDLIGQINDQRNVLAQKQLVLQHEENYLQSIKSDLSQKQTALEQKLSAAQAVVGQLNADKAAALRQVKRLKAQLARELAAALGLAGRGNHGGAKIPGVLLVCPVDVPHAYSDDFGAPRFTTNPPHPHAGNDVVAPYGTPIRAPFDGLAVATPGGLGGEAVTVFGDFGYVYNAHLSAYGKLGPVTTGAVIGYVGTSGDAQGGVPHDHFELHPKVIPAHPWVSPYGYSVIKGAIDPYPYLNSVC